LLDGRYGNVDEDWSHDFKAIQILQHAINRNEKIVKRDGSQPAVFTRASRPSSHSFFANPSRRRRQCLQLAISWTRRLFFCKTSLSKLVNPLIQYFAEEKNVKYSVEGMKHELAFAFAIGDPSRNGRLQRFSESIRMSPEQVYLAFEAIDAWIQNLSTD
jgi:hypothetical protein